MERAGGEGRLNGGVAFARTTGLRSIPLRAPGRGCKISNFVIWRRGAVVWKKKKKKKEKEMEVGEKEVALGEEEEEMLSFRPNYHKAKGSVSPLRGSASVARQQYSRDQVMALNRVGWTLPPDFLTGLSPEEQLLVLQGEEVGPLDDDEPLRSPPLAHDRPSPTLPPSDASPKLRPGRGAWIAPSAIGGLGMTSESKVVGAAKGIFNKLTRLTFDKLSDELLALLNKHPEQLEEFVCIIFENACLDPAFCSLYATLCVKIASGFRDPLASSPADTRRKVLRVLLEKCQAEFQSSEKADKEREVLRAEKAAKVREQSQSVIRGGMEDPNDPHAVPESEMELEARLRNRKLGNVSFMAELFRLQMIPEKTIHGCIIYLLRNIKTPAEEDVEHLCRLLTIAGKEIDTIRARSYVDQYFDRISQMARRPTLPSRLRFMLQDVAELRASGWSEVRRGALLEEESRFTLSAGGGADNSGGGAVVSTSVSPGKNAAASSAGYQSRAPEAVVLSAAEVARIKQEMRFILDEYVVSEDVGEVVDSIGELRFGELSVEFQAIFVYMSMIFAMERGAREQKLVSRALTQLKAANLLSASDFIKSWSKIIEELTDIEADIMFVRSYLADFIVAAIQTGCVSRAQFGILLERHRTDNCRAVCEMVEDLLVMNRAVPQ